jgi:trypsin
MKITSATMVVGAMVWSLHTLVMAAHHPDEMRDLIIGGRDANIGEFPFFVAGFGCGGTLIHEDIVLTAAHCNEVGIFTTTVQIGGTINPLLGIPDGEIIPTVCILNHPDYVPILDGMGRNDIALIKLARPSSAPLVELNFDRTVPIVNEIVTAIGYGISGYERIPDEPSIPLNPLVLQVLSPQFIQSENTCRAGDPEEYDAKFHLCINDNDPYTTICQGDSGGPILTEDGAQVGIASYATINTVTGECLLDSPTYWTKVSKFESFIKEGICGKCAVAAIPYHK